MDNIILETSELHVSAIVQIGKLTTNINLYELANNLCINDKISYIEHGVEITKGYNPKNKPKNNSFTIKLQFI